MTEQHECEWVRSFYGDWICKVDGCDGTLSYTQVYNRLNEYETLKKGNVVLLEALKKIHDDAVSGVTGTKDKYSMLFYIRDCSNTAIRKSKENNNEKHS